MKKNWKYYDYCHNPYVPIRPVVDKSSSDLIFKNSLQQSPYQKDLLTIMNKLRDSLGPWSTVWGVKWDRKNITWELYFYDNGRKDPCKKVENVLKTLRSYFKIPEFKDIGIAKQSYFMFSIDFSDSILKSRQIKNVHLYMEGRSGVSQGNSYCWGPDGIVFENYYDFYLMPQEAKQLIYKIKQSIFLGPNSLSFLKMDLVRKLMSCHKICVAHKKNTDGVYFSRVNVDQLLYFLEYFSYPNYIVDFVKSHKNKLDHLLYDVAVDFFLGPKGPIFSKSSYYNVF